MRYKTVLLAVLPLLSSAGCNDLTAPRVEPLAPESPATLEIVSADESRVVMSVSENNGNPVFLEFSNTGTVVNLPSEAVTSERESQANEARGALFWGVVVAAARVWSVVETIRVCAAPVYQEIRRSGGVSQRTTEACATDVSLSVTGGVVAKLAIPTVKITPLRKSIKSMVGSVITHRQLQKVINKKTKANIVDLIQEMTSIFYGELWKGFGKVFEDNGIR